MIEIFKITFLEFLCDILVLLIIYLVFIKGK